jgi:hypothetical protein
MLHYYLIVFMWFVSYFACAQTVKVTVDTSEIESPRKYIPLDTAVSLHTIPSLGKTPYKTLVNPQKVYSAKQWETKYDSLVGLKDINIPSVPEFKPEQLSERDVVERVNQKIGEAGIAIPTASSVPDAETLQPNLPALPSYELEDIAKTTLPPLPGSTIKSKYLTSLDSIRQVNLRENAVKLTESKINAAQKVSSFRRVPSLIERSYLEGVLGMAVGGDPLYQITPCWGFHVFRYISIGAGPNLLVWKEKKQSHSSLGLKVFTKVEFLKRRAYLQVEDLMDSYTVNEPEQNNKFYEKHNLFVGGGWLLSISTPVTLNLSLLYNVSDREIAQQSISPFIFRIGFSTVKIEK